MTDWNHDGRIDATGDKAHGGQLRAVTGDRREDQMQEGERERQTPPRVCSWKVKNCTAHARSCCRY